jgi:hypothetical protein
MNLMLETKLPDFFPGSPVKYDSGKTWTLLNTLMEGNGKITNFKLLYFDQHKRQN